MSARWWGAIGAAAAVVGLAATANGEVPAATDLGAVDPAADAGSTSVQASAAVARRAIILPARVFAGASAPATRRLRRLARRLDALLTDTAQDLGMTVDLGQEVTLDRTEPSALTELSAARHAMVVLPVLRAIEGEGERLVIQLELRAAEPDSSVWLTRSERVAPRQASVKAVVMLRDIVRRAATEPAQPRSVAPPAALATPAGSSGRAILAVNSTLYGGFIGLSLQRASKSDDPRLLYPLIGVGAGVGLGAAVIVADEWDVGVGDAWYLAAGGWWPAVAGHLIYQGRFADRPGATEDGPWSLGLIASTAGLTLSTVGLLPRGMGDGGAALAHSGGAIGLLLGGMTEFAVTGVSDEVPYGGLGYGAMGGWLLASAVAINFHPNVVRVLTTDVGLLLGGLAGASAASPLLFDQVTPAKTRGWVAATSGGMLAGGALAWWLGRDVEPPSPVDGEQPSAGHIARIDPPQPLLGYPASPGEVQAPAMGLQLTGELW